MVTWIKARILYEGKLGISNKQKAFKPYEIEMLKDGHWIYAKLILMKDALIYWKDRLIGYSKVKWDKQEAYIFFQAGYSKWEEAYKKRFSFRVYFIFEKEHIRQDFQEKIDLFMYPPKDLPFFVSKTHKQIEQTKAWWRNIENG